MPWPPTTHDDVKAAVDQLKVGEAGSATNMHTNINAQRNNNLPQNYWLVSGTPPNATETDIIYLTGPGQVTGVATSAVSATSVTVSHTALTGADSYQHYRKLNSESTWTLVATVTGTSYIHTGLTSSTSYNFYVVGVSSTTGVGSPSAIVTQSTSAAPTSLANHTFESTVEGFSNTGAGTQGSPTVARVTDRFATGTASLKITNTVASESKAASGELTVSPNTTYTISGKLSTNKTNPMTIVVVELTSGSGYITETYGGLATVTSSTSFTPMSRTVITGSTTGKIRYGFFPSGGNGATFAIGDAVWLDDIVVQ